LDRGTSSDDQGLSDPERISFGSSDLIVRLKREIRGEELRAIGRNRRFMASERRRQRGAAHAAMLVTMAVAIYDIFVVATIHETERTLLIAVNLAVAVAAGAGLLVLRGPGRRHPHIVVSTMALGIALASVFVGIAGKDLGVLALGFLLILPTVVTLVVPSRPWEHLRWLLAFAVGAFSFLVLAPAESLNQVERGDGAALLLVAIVVSFVGSVLRFRARANAHTQVVVTRRLRQESEANRRALGLAQGELELALRLDVLTGLSNRRRLHEDLAIARARLGRTGESFGLLEADLDFFKAINDRSGHIAGDVVLHDIAAVFRRESRATDGVYRFGGEEFVFLLPSADAAVTLAAAERIRAAVQEAAISHPANPPTGVVTVSVGGAVVGPSDLQGTDEAWLERVDRALYRAKTEGRNRVVMETADG
jgi:diguanylate cyclase (GGDEF)-like protein